MTRYVGQKVKPHVNNSWNSERHHRASLDTFAFPLRIVSLMFAGIFIFLHGTGRATMPLFPGTAVEDFSAGVPNDLRTGLARLR